MGHRTCVMCHWAQAWVQPQKACGPRPRPARFLRLGPGPGPMAHDVGPMSNRPVQCPVALSSVLWPCPSSYGPGMSCGPVLCPMALSDVQWPCRMSHDPALCPVALASVPCIRQLGASISLVQGCESGVHTCYSSYNYVPSPPSRTATS